VIKSLLTFQKIEDKRLEALLAKKFSDELLVYLGENQKISKVVEKLLGLSQALDYKLASNKLLSTMLLNQLYAKYGNALMLPLSSNVNVSVALLETFYQYGGFEVLCHISANPSTPKHILTELCERNNHALNRHLAVNPSVDLFYLEAFQLDTELMMLMTQNQTFLESIAHK
jgi:hypothetical protein